MRGDLYPLRAAKDTVGHEQRGPRYAVAIQSDSIVLSTLIVVRTSTSAQPAIFRPEIESDGTRLGLPLFGSLGAVRKLTVVSVQIA